MSFAWKLCVRFFVVLVSIYVTAFAQEGSTPAKSVDVQRVIARYEFDSVKGAIRLELMHADAQTPFSVERATLAAIGDEHERGRRVTAGLSREAGNRFVGEFALDEGQWNFDLSVAVGDETFSGQRLINVERNIGQAVSVGTIVLLPPNPEVSRFSLVILLGIGIPMGIGIVVGLIGFLQMRRAKQKEETAG